MTSPVRGIEMQKEMRAATSHQFEGRYTPLFESGAELFAWMQSVERHEVRHGRHHPAIGFLILDENFLMNRALVDELRLLNREQLLRGTQYQLFVFSDARVLADYTVEELLETGVDSVWVGLESRTAGDYPKLAGIDADRRVALLRALMGSLQRLIIGRARLPFKQLLRSQTLHRVDSRRPPRRDQGDKHIRHKDDRHTDHQVI